MRRSNEGTANNLMTLFSAMAKGDGINLFFAPNETKWKYLPSNLKELIKEEIYQDDFDNHDHYEEGCDTCWKHREQVANDIYV